MQSFELVDVIFGAFTETFKRVLRILLYFLLGILITLATRALYIVIFKEAYLFENSNRPGTGSMSELQDFSLQGFYIVILVFAVVLLIFGVITAFREMANSSTRLSLMTSGALLMALILDFLGFELSPSAWLLLAILLLSAFQLIRWIEIINTAKWEAKLDSIEEQNKARRKLQKEAQDNYIKQMERNG